MNISTTLKELAAARTFVRIHAFIDFDFSGVLDRVRIGNREVYRVIWHMRPERWFVFTRRAVAGIDHKTMEIYLTGYTYRMFSEKVGEHDVAASQNGVRVRDKPPTKR